MPAVSIESKIKFRMCVCAFSRCLQRLFSYWIWFYGSPRERNQIKCHIKVKSGNLCCGWGWNCGWLYGFSFFFQKKLVAVHKTKSAEVYSPWFAFISTNFIHVSKAPNISVLFFILSKLKISVFHFVFGLQHHYHHNE